jgi:hypothetical protein
VDHADAGLSSIVALHDSSTIADAGEWSTRFGDSHVVLADTDNAVWDQYRDSRIQPQYVVFDRDMTILYKGQTDVAKEEAEALILGLLGE